MKLLPRPYQLAIFDSIVKNGNTLVVLPTGLGKCLEYSQPVLLANGKLTKIGELFKNSGRRILQCHKNRISVEPQSDLQVISLNSKLKMEKRKIVAIHKIKTGKKLLRIVMASGAEITVTSEHPLLTLGQKLDWRRADKFDIGDFVAVPAFLPEPVCDEKIDPIAVFTSINSNAACFVILKDKFAEKCGLNKEQNLKTLLQKSARRGELSKGIAYFGVRGGRSDPTPINAITILSPDLFYWAGLVIAEGSPYGSLKFYNVDEGLLGLFSNITRHVFGLTPKKIRGGLVVESTALHFFARNVFDIKNQHSREKIISDTVMTTNNRNVAAFISALYDGNGSIRKDGLIEFMTASDELAHRLCYLLLRFGIKSRLKEKISCATNSSRPLKRKYFRVYIEGIKDLKLFKDHIGFRHKEKQQRLEQYLDRKVSYNPDYNLIPVAGSVIRTIRRRLGLSSTAWKDFQISGIDTYERGERKFSHNTLRNVIEGFRVKEASWSREVKKDTCFLETLLESHVYWDRIKQISTSKAKWVYDLTLDADFNFIAGKNGGAVAHNTLIALMLIEKRMVLPTANGRCFILTPTKPLAKQHYHSVRETMGLSEDEVALVNGEIAPAKRKKMYLESKVIISTPQTIGNDLENGILEPKASLIVFDECHRAIGNYAYTKVAERLESPDTLFVGLTASPGGNRQKIKEVMDALHIKNVEIRTHEDPDVSPYVQKSEVTWVPVELSDHFKKIKKELDLMSGIYAQKLSALGFPPPLKHKGQFMQMRARILANQTNLKYPALVNYSILLHLLHMTELIETQGVYPLREYILKLKEKDSKSAARLLADSGLRKVEELVKEEQDHPKLRELVVQVRKLAGKKAIVFVQYRSQISRIVSVLTEQGIRAKQFVGKKDGVTRKVQEETIAEFRTGAFDVLVASSIGEEGLDIPAVDTVIFYEPVPSEIRTIQRRGRAARMKEGQVIVLMTRGTRDEFHHYASRNRERKMKTIIGGMKNKAEGRLAVSRPADGSASPSSSVGSRVPVPSPESRYDDAIGKKRTNVPESMTSSNEQPKKPEKEKKKKTRAKLMPKPVEKRSDVVHIDGQKRLTDF